MEDDLIYKDEAEASFRNEDEEVYGLINKEKLYEITQQIEFLSEKILNSTKQNEIWSSCEQIFSLLLPICQNMKLKESDLINNHIKELSHLFNEKCIISFFKTLQAISSPDQAIPPLYCLSYALYFNNNVTQFCNDPDLFHHLSSIFEEAMYLQDENMQTRVMVPISYIIMQCCNSSEDVERILSSGILDHIINFLIEIVKDKSILDDDPSVVTYTEANEKELIMCISTLLVYYQLFEPSTVALLFDLARQSIINKHKESLKLSCELITRFYVSVPEAFSLIVLPYKQKNIFDYMLDVVEGECEEEIPTGFDISPIFIALRTVLEKSPRLIMIYDEENQINKQTEESLNSQSEKTEKITSIENDDEKWKNHYEYANVLSRRIDPDLIFNYAWNRRSIMMGEEECKEANEALLLLSTKIILDEEVSTDIEINNINDLVEVSVQSGHYSLKEAFGSFLFAYIQYAPEFLLNDLFSTEAIPDFISLIEGCDMKCLPIILNAFIRIVDVLGFEWNQSDTYKSLIEHIKEFVDNSERIEPSLDWKFDIIDSHFQVDD